MKKNKWLYALLLLCIILVGCGKKEEPIPDPIPDPEPVVENYSLSLITVGDALIHNGIYIDANTYQTGSDGHYKYDFNKMFTYIKDIIAPYDLKFYNQETIIGGKNLGLSNYPLFNSPDEIGLDLIKTGFNLVNLATNHTLDKGAIGAEYSANFWKNQENVYVVGSYVSQEERDKPFIQEKNGITYTLLGYTTSTNGISVPAGKPYLVNVYNKEKVKADIEAVRDKVDIVMVSMHWGIEYVHTPVTEQIEIANYLSSLGVDIIIGHHPHSIQPIEYVNDTVVIYSLGNFISAQAEEDQRVGLMAALTINKTTVDGETTELKITDVKGDLIWTDRTPYYSQFKIIPFNKLTDAQLWNHKNIYEKYKKYINPKNDERIKVGFFE